MPVLTESLVGQIFDERYEILSVLGSGGMGSVYKAKQIGLNRILALKILHLAHLSDKDSRMRFEREGKVLSQFSHHNIIAFYRFGLYQVLYPYIAMEYLEGSTLRTLLNAHAEQTPLDWRRAVRISIQVCDAMQYAHDRQVIHRDLKPENIMLLAEPEPDFVKVVDFGLAKAIAENNAQKLTQTGALIGSVHYLSPEQCQGHIADSRSDIYSLGCVLYECILGEQPYSSDNPVGIIYKHVNEAPRSFAEFKIGKKLPPELEYVLLKAMEKTPEKRYQKMSEFQSDLNLILLGKNDEILAPKKLTTGEKSASRFKLFAVLFLVLILVSIPSVFYFYDPVFKMLVTAVTAGSSKTDQEKDIEIADNLARFARTKAALEVYDRVASSPGSDEFLTRIEALAGMARIYSKQDLSDQLRITTIKALKLLNREMLSRISPNASSAQVLLDASEKKLLLQLLNLSYSSVQGRLFEITSIYMDLIDTCIKRKDLDSALLVSKYKAMAFEQKYGKHTLEYWQCLIGQSSLLASFGHAKKSQALFTYVLDDIRRSDGSASMALAAMQLQVGYMCYRHENRKEAFRLWKDAEHNLLQLIAKETSEKPGAFFLLAEMKFVEKDQKKAEAYYKEGQNLSAHLYGQSSDFYLGRCCDVANHLADVHLNEQAEKILRDLIRDCNPKAFNRDSVHELAQEALRGGRDEGYLLACFTAADFLRERGLYGQAQKLLQRVVYRKELNAKMSRRQYFMDLMALGEAAGCNGDIAVALEAFRRAELLKRPIDRDTYPEVVRILNAEAALEEKVGNKKEAAKIRERCQTIMKAWQ